MAITGRTPGKSTSTVLNQKIRPYKQHRQEVSENANRIAEIALGLIQVLDGMIASARTRTELHQATLLLLPIMNRINEHDQHRMSMSANMLDQRIAEIFSGSENDMKVRLREELHYYERELRSLLIPDRFIADEYSEEISKIWSVIPSRPIVPMKFDDETDAIKLAADDGTK